VIHDFDPAIVRIGAGGLWWYGAIYTVGFLGILGWFWWRRVRLGLSGRDVFGLTIWLAVGMMIGGRVFDILVYELDYYRANPWHALDWWRGGMATHGVMLGGLIGAAVFAVLRRYPLLVVLDELVVPGCFLMAVGRLGNFIEGGVIGTVTSMPWGFVYPDLEGPRHPVALYDSLKNLMIVPVLALALRRWPAGSGVTMALFLLLYGWLRFLVDLTRDYESVFLGLGPGQVYNLAMGAVGLVLLIWLLRHPRPVPVLPRPAERRPGIVRVLAVAFLVLYPLGIPTSWTKVNIEAKRSEAAAEEGGG
jgi:phosphatidylglycerol:prolipoprotein diacylglycerol transferase